MKSQYAASIVAVAVSTYLAAVGLAVFVDRRKVMLYFKERPSAILDVCF